MTAVSKGKGFAGVMKRHGFKGQRASHGAHRVHRMPGSIGACATPARVFKGTRMAGRMGGEQVTTLNLTVVEADADRDLLLDPGRGPRPQGRHRAHPQRRESRGEELMAETKSAAKATKLKPVKADLDDAVFGIEPNRP